MVKISICYGLNVYIIFKMYVIFLLSIKIPYKIWVKVKRCKKYSKNILFIWDSITIKYTVKKCRKNTENIDF